MKRRSFLSALPFGLFPAIHSVQAVGTDVEGNVYGTSQYSGGPITSLGGMTLAELRDFHTAEIEEKYVALWDTGGIDLEYGGFIPRWDENGNFTTDIKNMYYLGRGLWVFSLLYNHFGKREHHLEAVRTCWDFMVKYCRDPKTGWWLSKVTRDGRPVEGPVDIYGDMYVILGLTEYYKTVDDPSLLDIAIGTAHGINERIVSPGYQHIGAHKDGFPPGTKILGTWQHFLGSLTPLARETGDDGVSLMARMCVRNMLERHFSKEYGVYFEYLDDSFRPFPPGYDQEVRKVSSWHGVQSAWMCMDEALRIGDRAMFMKALETGRLTLERCWLAGDNGGLIGLDYPEQPIGESSDEPYWGRLDDALVFILLAVEHSGAPWAESWFDTVFSLGCSKPDRWNRTGLLHHPRRLIFAVEILDRIIARGGRVSDFLERG